jgi:2-keto-4-pentenoate hydratase/2-oxohepta-3-ene-1,7-dioic acid hydratase in catechol pathway
MPPEGDAVISVSELGFRADDMNGFIRESSGGGLAALAAGLEGKKTHCLQEIKLLAPIPYPEHDVICLGLNYRDHAAEAEKAGKYGRQRGEAVYFSKRVDRAVAPGERIQSHFDICDTLDYEAELAVVIGRDAKDVRAIDAGEYILGYTILNDVSARNLQTKHGQWYFGKSLDGFTPMGPWIVTADELPGAPDLGIRCFVNGEKRQESRTGNMIFDIPYIIEELSRGMTLQAGTIISTGTPSGVAMGMESCGYLRSGDVVRCEIDGIGVLENAVI